MSHTDVLDLLRQHDPAADLTPLPLEQRAALRERIVHVSPAQGRISTWQRRRRIAAVPTVVVVAVLAFVGVAWAADSWSPLALFETNPQSAHGAPGGLWTERVVPSSVVEAAKLAIPKVGAIGFWYGTTSSGGWCGALRLPSGSWVGTGKDPLDAGGTVPGCFPTRNQINSSSSTPVFVIDGFDYQEGLVDARSAGGSFWRIRYGLVDSRAVRVTDLVSGRSADVVHGVFALAIADPHPTGRTPIHLVAYDSAGKVVADDSATA